MINKATQGTIVGMETQVPALRVKTVRNSLMLSDQFFKNPTRFCKSLLCRCLQTREKLVMLHLLMMLSTCKRFPTSYLIMAIISEEMRYNQNINSLTFF